MSFEYSFLYKKFLLLLLSIGILSFITKSMLAFDIGLYLGLVSGSILFLLMINNPLPNILWSYIFIALIGTTFLFVNNGIGAGKVYLPIILSSVGIALAIYRTLSSESQFHLNLSGTIFYGLCIYFLAYFVFNGNFNDAIFASRNHVSVNLILSFSYYAVVRKQLDIEVPIIGPIFIALISFLAVGISGIIASLIILFGYFFTRNLKSFILFFASIPILYFSFDWIYILGSIDDDLIRKILYKLVDGDIRSDIVTSYIQSLNIKTLMIGVPLNELEWMAEGLDGNVILSDNLHSSYLLLHSKIGFMSFLVFFGLLIVLFKLIKKDFFIFFIFLAILVRAITDTIVLSHGYYEWALILILLFAVNTRERNQIG